MPEEENTFFAPAGRSDQEDLGMESGIVCNTPLINVLMQNVSGLLAVLNSNRQILSVNDTLLKMLGIDSIERVFGLRPGEAIKCIHSGDPPDGCGTTQYCSTCGLAIAIVSSLGHERCEERDCTAVIEKNGEQLDIYLRVRACPFTFDEHRFILLFMQDITANQQRATLERAFFHDINTIVQGLSSTCERMTHDSKFTKEELTERLTLLTSRLQREVEIQRELARQGVKDYAPAFNEVSAEMIIREVQTFFSNHPAANSTTLTISGDIPVINFSTDFAILIRVLTNMLVNALEATITGEVKMMVNKDNNNITFSVWSRETIPEDIAKRIFQKNFSTKQGSGRGLGTFIMKFFGEGYLRGKVSFTTSEAEGTTFRITLPI